MSTNDYRQTLYSNYVSRFKGVSSSRRKGEKNTLWRYREWLPEELSSSILEVACGQGLFLSALQERGYQNTLGIDFSEEQVASCTRSSGKVICGDAIEFLESGTQKFDLIIAIDFLEHLRKGEVVRFLAAAHASSPCLILQVPNAAAPRGMHHQAGDFTHESMFSPSSLRQVLLTSNYSSTEFREVGPLPLSAKGIVRSALWTGLKSCYKMLDFVELGGVSGLYSRNMLVKATR